MSADREILELPKTGTLLCKPSEKSIYKSLYFHQYAIFNTERALLIIHQDYKYKGVREFLKCSNFI